jgi:integrase
MKTAAELVVSDASSTLAVAPELVQQARAYASAATSENTRKAYARQWAAFTAWCSSRGLASFPAEPSTVALYASDLAQQGRKVATIEQAMAAVSGAHGAAGLPSPREDANLRRVLRGIRRELTVAQRQAAPILKDQLHAMVEAVGQSKKGQRDAALLLVGFAAALRRSELVGLEVRDVAFTVEGLVITLRRSKTDQTGEGRKVPVSYSGTVAVCPVRALRAWLDTAGIVEGPLFREVNRHGQVQAAALTGRSVSRLVKDAAQAAGLDPTAYSGHSMRAGFVTVATLAGRGEASIMKKTGHKSVAMMRKYQRAAELWKDDAGAGLLD